VILTLIAVAPLPDRSKADLAAAPMLTSAARQVAGRAAGG